MAVSLKHAFTSPVADNSDPDEVGPDEWNAEHTLLMATARLLGRTTAGTGAVEELSKSDVLAFLNVEDGATAGSGMSAADILAALLTVDGAGSGLDADTLDGNSSAAFAASSHTHTASAITDFDTEVSNNTDVAANTAARHAAVTVTDSAEINFTLTGQDITAALVAGSIDETKLDTSVNASLDLADSALQPAATATLSNKRFTPRTTTITSSGTPTVNTDNTDIVNITALAAAITSMTTNLSGTPVIGDVLIYQIKDDGTARAITWGASFTAKGAALPVTTVLSKLLTVAFVWNGSDWGCVGSAQEA
jgi:hypothetical protein